MTHPTPDVESDEAYQEAILPHVSRTFALTIPQLPAALSTSVTSAYLLCRIADTIEDEPALSAADTHVYLQRFAAAVRGREDAARLAHAILPRLSPATLAAERDLIANMPRVIRRVGSLGERQRGAIERCIEVMGYGMHHFRRTASLRGLARSIELDAYCYYVAGVVGEMLTELFCAYSPKIERQRAALYALAPSFGQGLQMTNILKDVWEDHGRGVCWLPQEVFSRHGLDLAELAPRRSDRRFQAAMLELIAVAHGHLRNALAFTLLIPAEEAGIRRFCLWAIGLAALTLRRIQDNPGFTCGQQVKVSRAAVAMIQTLTGLSVSNDGMLRKLFERATRGLPLPSHPECSKVAGGLSRAVAPPA